MDSISYQSPDMHELQCRIQQILRDFYKDRECCPDFAVEKLSLDQAGKTVMICFLEPCTAETQNPTSVGIGSPENMGSLKCRLKETLPVHLMPDGFVLVEKLPRTATGTIDRSHLKLMCDSTSWFSFWNVSLLQNTWERTETHVSVLDRDLSLLLLSNSNKGLRTEPIEIVLGTLIYTFSEAFTGHPLSWVSLQSIEGGHWGTSQCLSIPSMSNSTPVQAVMAAKDARRGVQRPPNMHVFGHPELSLTYTRLPLEEGKRQDETLDQPTRSSLREALIGVEVTVKHSQIVLSIHYPKDTAHDVVLKAWAETFAESLQSTVSDLSCMDLTFTKRDFPLIDLSYRGLNSLQREQLPGMGVRPADVVDVYPCSPLQEGVLLSSSSYAAYYVWRCVPGRSQKIDTNRLEMAWKTAVSQHEIFATIFCQNPDRVGFVQIVLGKPEVRISQMPISSGCPFTTLSKMESPRFNPDEPKYAVTICQSEAGDVSCRFDICHTMYDYGSLSVVLQDVLDVYVGKVPSAPPPFSQVVKHIASKPESETIGFWTTFLHGVQPCLFPVLCPSPPPEMQDIHDVIIIPRECLGRATQFCQENGITRSTFMHIAWGLVLSYFTGTDELCFGYMVSGRDAPVYGIERIFGPLANMVVSRVDLRKPLKALFQSTAEMLKEHRRHQQTSLAEVQHRLGVSSGCLFNTMVSLLRADTPKYNEHEAFSFKKHESVSSHEFDLAVEGLLHPDSMDLCIYYRKAFVTRQLAEEIAETLTWAAHYLVSQESYLQRENGLSIETHSAEACGGRTERISESFFNYLVGADQACTKTFWKEQFVACETTYSPPAKDVAAPKPERTHFVTESDNVRLSCSFPAELIAKASWAIVISQAENSRLVSFGTDTGKRQPQIHNIRAISGTDHHILPMMMSLDWNCTVSQFLEDLQRQVQEISKYNGVGLHWIRQIGAEAYSACSLQSLLLFRPSEDEIPAHNIAPAVEWDENTTTFECQFVGKRLRTRIGFDRKTMTASHSAHLSRRFHHIFRQLTDSASGGQRLKDAMVICERDLAKIWKWNAHAPKPANVCVHDLIKSKVLLHPDKTAICAWNGSLTYAQLDELSTRLACRLIALGIGQGDIVPLFFEKSMWMPVAMLGVAKTGAAALGLDLKQPTERLRTITKQVKPQLALSSEKNRDLALNVTESDVNVVDDKSLAETTPEREQFLPEVDPSAILYMVFTSGSTGTPKGVLISHASYSSAIMNQLGVWGIKDTSRVFDFASYAFDAVWFNLLHTLTSGGCLCIPSNEELQNNLSGCIEKYDVTVSFLTPSVARHMNSQALGKLETILLGGEMVFPEDVSLSSEKTQIKVIYGPSECTPMTTCHDIEGDRSIAIGRGHGVCTWIVNPEPPYSLKPIGMVGELWLEGPALGQGYFNDAEKTAASFINNPDWLTQGTPQYPGREGRMYRTGDLVRYRDDGTLVFVGRRDTQVKIRGQRLELSEVERHVQTMLQTQKSHGQGSQVVAETIRPEETHNLMLVVFITLTDAENHTEKEHSTLVRSATSGLIEDLSKTIPAYMVPNAIIPIYRIPVNINGKRDRTQLRRMGIAAWRQYNVTKESKTNQASTDMEKLLQEVWMTVLNLPAEAISINKPFTRLGGDSITAMQVVSECRARNVSVTVGDILQAQTIEKVALKCAKMSVNLSPILLQDDDTTEPFGLSPIQRKYFDMFPQGMNHFNQSFILDLNRDVPPASVHDALKAVVRRHHMLRARYQKNTLGIWEQFYSVGAESFIFAEHNVSRRSDVLNIAQDRQAKMDIVRGPVFSADLFHVQSSRQMLVLSAHHLVVDLVSWRIIWNDVEEHISSSSLSSYKAPSFHSWCKLQSHMANDLEPNSVLPFEVPVADYAFWEMSSTPNIRSDAKDCVKRLDHQTTELLLGDSNKALRTEALDIIIGSYAYSFQRAFPERNVPAVFVEGHGREQSENLALDVSGTVGWFTTMHPIPIKVGNDTTVIDAVRIAKDNRRRVPGKGQPYFAARYHNQTCHETFKDHDHIELLLNFAGRYQQLESDDALFKLAGPFESGRTLEVVAASSSRVALIEANMAIQDGKLAVTLTYNTRMKHQDRLEQWLQGFMDTLHLATHSLHQEPAGFTLSDFDLLPISYRGLEKLLNQQLPDMRIKSSEIVDIYAASPLQEGILLSSHKGISSYATFWIWKCGSVAGRGQVSASKLELAWRAVVKRHPILSTVFATHPEGNGFIQILLADAEIKVAHMNSNSGNPYQILGKIQRPQFSASEPEHAFTICEASGEIACRLDINHTLIDGGSLTPLVQDLMAAYDQSMRPSAPAFKEMMHYLSKTERRHITSYWAKYLQGAKPCEVPVSPKVSWQGAEDTFRYIPLPNERMAEILKFCKHAGITRAVFLQVAWAMVLSQITGMREVCFGYLASGRNAEVDGIENMVGPLANMLVSRIELSATAAEVLQATSTSSIEHLGYQHASLAEVQHKIGLSGRRLFNTAMTVRQEDQFGCDESRTLSLEHHSHQDPHEFDLILSGRIQNENVEVSIQIREASVSRQLAEETAGTLRMAIEHLLKSGGACENAPVPAPLYHSFFNDAVGKDENSTLLFWKDYFMDLDVNCFPPLETPQPRSLEVKHVSLRISEFHCQGREFTPTITARAAWSIVAAKNASSSEALFGTIIETSKSTGTTHCVLPMRCKLSWDGDGNDLLENVKEQMATMQGFKSLNSQFIARASPEAAMASKFQSLLVVEDNTGIEPIDIAEYEHTYSLIVNFRFEGNEVVLTVKYETAAFSEGCARRIANQLEQALRWLSSARLRASKLWDAVGISSKELDQVWAWNKLLPKAVNNCVHELVHHKASLAPDAPAVCAWDGDLTYEQLDNLSTNLAHHLIHLGIGSGHIVPICFEKSMWAPVAMLGVMKTGAASVMMDVTQPDERLKTILNQVDCHVTLSSNSNQDVARRIGADDILVVNGEELECMESSDDELPSTDPSDIIYAVFTSGSTGMPKGTLISHQNISSMIAYQQHALGISDASRVFDFASYAFDVSWDNFLHALTSGGCLCIPSEADRKDNIEASINGLRANYAHITPTILRHLDWSKLSTITVLNLSGEAVSARDKNITGPNVKVVNAYGPAETNVVSIQDLSALPGEEVSIGCGAGACTWVVDDQDVNRLAPIGSIGELWIEGPLVGLGYLDDAGKTAAAFVSDPTWLLSGSSNQAGRKGRLYRTGDLVRYNPDGSLQYIGRKDTQVKISGQRIELGEVETNVKKALERLDNNDYRVIADIIKPQGTEKQMLVAFVSLVLQIDVTPEAQSNLVHRVTKGLSDPLSNVLPAYAIPSAYIPITDIPLTATGKTDRRRLKAIGASKTVQEIASLGQSDQTRRKPNSQAERLLQKLWAIVLGIEIESIGMDDSFFRIGGDSIGAMKLVSLARDEKLSLTVQGIFQNPVLHRMSLLVSTENSSRFKAIAPYSLLKSDANQSDVRASAARLCNVQQDKVMDILPCTSLQETLLSRYCGDIESMATQHVLEIHKGVELERFQDAWNQVVSRNPIMRTRIVHIPEQGYVQVVLDDTIQWFLGKSLDECGQYSLKHPMAQGARLAKFGVVHSEDSRRDFVWEMHWALYDGWGLRLLLAEAEKIYFNTAVKPLENVAALSKYTQGLNKNKAMFFWRRQFENLQGSHFPPQVSRVYRPRIDSEVSVVAPDLQESDGGFTSATIIRAALSLVIGQNLKSSEAIFGATVTGRQTAVPGIERMAGPAFATLPIRVPIDWSMTGKKFLEMVHNQATDMIPFEQTSLKQIRQAGDEAASACDFQTLLVVQSAIRQGDFRSRDEANELFVKGLVAGKGAIVELGQRSGEYSMFVECQLGMGDDIRLRICFDSAVLEAALAERILCQFERTIRNLSRGEEKDMSLSQLVGSEQ